MLTAKGSVAREARLIRRREFVALLGVAAAMLPSPVTAAWSPSTVRRVGVLMPLAKSDPIAQRVLGVFIQGLQKLGWPEDKNFAIELRYSEGKPERLPALAVELVQTNIDVLVVWAAQAVDAARKATTTIPVVITGVGDALGAGYIASLAHPGGNITGFTLPAP